LINKITNSVQKIVEDDNKFFNLNFSFEGPQEINDSIRGKGTFDRAIKSYKECAKIREHNPNLKLGITTTMCSINQDHISSFFKWAYKELKPDQINCLMIRQDPRGGKELKDVDWNNYQEVRDLLKTIRYKINPDKNNIFYHQLSYMNDLVYDTHEKMEKQFTCHAGTQGAFIDYDGSVNVCEVFCDKELNDNHHNLSIGNLRDHDMDFFELWNSEKADQIRSQVNKSEMCKLCTHETEGLIPSLFIAPNILSKFINKP
jgi:radical SAM protein with 4Fe4S-binding SPASM domain